MGWRTERWGWALVVVLAAGGCAVDDGAGEGEGEGEGEGDACSAGPATLAQTVVSFRRSANEVEVYRFADATFTRDIAPGEASENTGGWTWTGAPHCTLQLDHAAVPPDWPDAFSSTYVLAWDDAAAGTFTLTRTFADGFSFAASGTMTAAPQ